MNGICMSCGKTFLNGRSRAFLDGMFSAHNEEKHRRMLNKGSYIEMRVFTGEPPIVKVKREVVRISRDVLKKKRLNELATRAVWI